MDAPAAFLVIRLLIWDTFRQARAYGILWLMLGISALCIALCLSLTIEGDVPMEVPGANEHLESLPRSDRIHASIAVAGLVTDGVSQSVGMWTVPATWCSTPYQQVTAALRHQIPVAQGRLTLAFGAIPVELARDRRHTVRALQCILAGWVADSVGLLLALLWTAGFLPAFLEPSAISVLLAKPAPRWSLLAGKFIGTLIFVAFQGLIFVAGTWLALALRTGVWDPIWFLCLPLFVVHFAVFYSFSVLLAVMTRSTVVSCFGSILFWLVCWGMNFGRHTVLAIPEFQQVKFFGSTSELGYWILPKPLDFHLLLVQALEAENFTLRIVDVSLLAERNAWAPGLSVFTSMLAGLVLFAMASYEFSTTDY